MQWQLKQDLDLDFEGRGNEKWWRDGKQGDAPPFSWSAAVTFSAHKMMPFLRAAQA
jgi:hypothetical protein